MPEQDWTLQSVGGSRLGRALRTLMLLQQLLGLGEFSPREVPEFIHQLELQFGAVQRCSRARIGVAGCQLAKNHGELHAGYAGMPSLLAP